MGFMDKAREAAHQATTKAHHGIAQGQAKIDEVQTARAGDALLRKVGAAYYAEQRSGGSHEAVVAALSAMDVHVAAHGAPGQSGSQSSEGTSQAPWTPKDPQGWQPGHPSSDPFASPSDGSSAGPNSPDGLPRTDP